MEATIRALTDAFLKQHPDDAALVLERFDAPQAAALLAGAPEADAGGVLGQMSRGFAGACLEHADVARAATVLLTMPHHAAAALLRSVPEARRGQLLAAMPRDAGKRLGALMTAAADSVGALVDPRVLTVPLEASMRHARVQLRRFGRRERAPLYAYVVRPDQTLAGVLSLRRVLMAGPGEQVSTAMREPVVTVAASTSIDAALRREEWEHLHVLPVVDNVGVLLGSLRYDALRRSRTEREHPTPGASGLVALLSFTEAYLKGVASVVMGIAESGGREGGQA